MSTVELVTEYIPGGDADFVVFVQSLGNKAELVSIEGHARWLVTRDDGTKYIVRPESTKPATVNE